MIMRKFSFWKPDPIPSTGRDVSTSILEPIGNPEDVVRELLTIPQTTDLKFLDEVKVIWHFREGVCLSVCRDLSSLAKGNVLAIKADSAVSDGTFLRLYVQVFERFSAILLDESEGTFLTTHEFRKRF